MPDLALNVDAGQLAGVPRLDEYFGLWAVEEVRFGQMLEHVRGLDLRAHLANPAVREAAADANGPADLMVAQVQLAAGDDAGALRQQDRPLPVAQDAGTRRADDHHVRPVMSFTIGAAATLSSGGPGSVNIAVIDLMGTLMKQATSMTASSSTIRARRQIRDAAGNPDIDAILVRIDSPGGAVSGTADLAGDVQYAASRKPTWAFIEDLGASAAYWVASQAQRIVANHATALVGSIGTLGVVYDSSAAFALKGFKAQVFKTGPLKGAGMAGTDLTPEQSAYFQAMVEQTQQSFDAAVKAGRNLTDEQLTAVRTGGVFLAGEAQQRGLIDAVQRFDQVVADLAAAVQKQPPRSAGSSRRAAADGAQPKEPAMSGTNTGQGAPQAAQDNPTPQARPATVAELKAAFPKLDADFRESCLERGMTMAQAAHHAADTLQARLESRETELDEARKAQATATTKRPGTAGVGTQPSSKSSDSAIDAGGGDVVTSFDAKVREVARTEQCSRFEAVQRVRTREPELHKAYVAATQDIHHRPA